MSRRFLALLSCVLSLPGVAVAESDTPATVTTRYLTADVTREIVHTAVATCAAKGYKVAAAVMNRDGTLAAFLRDPLAGPHTEEVAQRKAFSSATFQTTTQQMADRVDIKFASRILLVQGGVPIEVAGQFYGAVAVSGASMTEDEVCARAGIAAVQERLEFAD